MDAPMTENDVQALEEFGKGFTMWTFQAESFLDFISRARALLAHRDLMIKERDDAVLKAQHAVNAEMKANEELTEIRHTLGGFAGPTYGIADRVKKVVADRDFYAKQASEADDTIKRVVAERDTLAARVKELEADVKSLDNSLLSSQRDRDAHREAHRLLAAGLGATPLCACCKRPVLGFVFCDSCEARAADRNGTSPPIPDPDPRDAEFRALKDELARVRGGREAIPGEGDLHVFSFLTKIREVLGCNKFGYDLVDAIKAMKEELEQAKKDAAFGRAALKHAEALGIDTNKDLGQHYHALRHDAEAWRRMFQSVHPDEASKIVIRYHFPDKDTKEVVVKDNGAPEYASKPPEGHMIHIPAEHCGDNSRMHAYADGYLAGKDSK